MAAKVEGVYLINGPSSTKNLPVLLWLLLESKVKIQTILINKSQLLLKALYLEATLTFLRFAVNATL